MKLPMKILLQRGGGGAAGFDSDAQAFFNADATLGALSGAQKTAINTLVLAAKAHSWWTPSEIIYPIIGGAATPHSFNLRNPAAFQIAWSGTSTHSANGVLSNGTDGYGNTNYVGFTDVDGGCMGYYSRTNVGDASYDMGARNASDGTWIQSRTAGNLQGHTYGQAPVSVANASSLGFFCTNRLSTTNTEGYKNGVRVVNAAEASLSGPQIERMFILCRNGGGSTPNGFSVRQCAFVFAAPVGFSTTTMTDMYNDIQAYQTALGRQV